MFGIQYRSDGSWWMSGTINWSAWTRDPQKALAFYTKDNALASATVKCQARADEYDAVELPTAAALDAHLGGRDA